MAFTFKYRREEIGKETFFFPKIPTLLFNKGHQIELAALLDSGATDIFIPKTIADALELEIALYRNPL